MTKHWQNRIQEYGIKPADQFTANPANPRIHPQFQREVMKAALDTLGWLAPVIENKRTGYLVDGHERVMQALLNNEPVPYVVVDLSEAEEATALATFDPITALANYDAAQLDALLRDVQTDSPALDKMLAELAEANGLYQEQDTPPGDAGAQLDRAAELQEKWQVKRGDLWQIGNHRLLCGDSTNADDVARLMAGEKADMVFTDPPYGMDLDTDFSSMESKLFKGKTGGNYHTPVIGDNVQFDPSPIFSMFGYCKEMFLWGADYYAEFLPDKNSGSWIVWDKRLDESADKMWGSSFELCWSKQNHKRDIARIKWAGIFGMETQDTPNRVHPTQKPVELVRWFFNRWGNTGEIVVDQYLGSGTTLVACEQTGRKGRGIEISEKYCAVILERMTGIGLTPQRISENE